MTTQTAATRPLLTIPTGRRAPRVVVIAGGFGTGHDAVARELARVLRDAGCAVEMHDVVTLLPWRLGPLLRGVHRALLRHRPSWWDATLRLLGSGLPTHRVVTELLRLAAGPVVEVTRGCDLVVATHPFGAQALGHARETGWLTAPAVTYLTDASVHPLWIHPGVDLNLAIHRVAADEAEHCGGLTAVVRPLVPPVVRTGVDPLAGHEIAGPWALVTGGSRGRDDLERACRDVLDTGLMSPVVLCGADARLRRRLSRIEGVVALGPRDDVPALMAASDCVIQSAGGLTSLEALASGTPVITYRPRPGHEVARSANLETAGLIPWARDPGDLLLLLAAARHARRIDRLPVGAPDVLGVLTGARLRVAAA